MASLCHPWFTTTNLSYRFPIFETSATALCGTTGTYYTCIPFYAEICYAFVFAGDREKPAMAVWASANSSREMAPDISLSKRFEGIQNCLTFRRHGGLGHQVWANLISKLIPKLRLQKKQNEPFARRFWMLSLSMQRMLHMLSALECSLFKASEYGHNSTKSKV